MTLCMVVGYFYAVLLYARRARNESPAQKHQNIGKNDDTVDNTVR